MLQLEPGMMIWTWVTFIVLFAVLAKVAWKPILAAVNQREETISDSLRKAEDAKLQAEKLLEEHREMMDNAQDEIQKLLKENKEAAEKMKNDIVENARKEAEKIRERAHIDIEREKDAAIAELKGQVADLVVQATSRLIREDLDNQKHRNLINDYIKELDQLDKN